MKEAAVVDSTCLIGLRQTGYLHLLPLLFEPILIPPEIERETNLKLPWLNVEPPRDTFLVSSLEMLIDAGEASAIALACEKQYRVILDDAKARAVATRLRLKIIGTAGILVLAKTEGHIPAVLPVLDALEVHNFFLSAEVRSEILKLCGE